MNILIAVHYFPPHVGGIENVARTQARLLAARGHSVTVFTSAVGVAAGTTMEDGYTVVRLPVWNYFERAMGVPFPFFSPSLIWKSYSLIKKSDVVHAHDAFYLTSLMAAIWAKLLKKRVVLTQHVDIIPHPKKIVNLVQKIVYRTTGRFVLQASHSIAILNSNVKRFLRTAGIAERKIIFVPNGVDTGVFHPDQAVDVKVIRRKYNLPADVPIALFVGRFVPKKGFTKLLKAGSDSYHIAFAGGSAPKGYENSLHHTFLGSRPPAEVAELYRAVDMFILPSEGEGFPLTVQEAMASRLPIIISDQPGYDMYDFDRSCMQLIAPSVPVIRETLAKLAENPDVRSTMGDYAYTYATAHFSWDKNIQSFERLYEGKRP